MLSLVVALLLSACDLDVATTAQLATLTSPAQRAAYRFELSVLDGKLQVRLVGDNGLIRSREVAATGVCEDDATVAAVILSAWMAEPVRTVPPPPKPRLAPTRPVRAPVAVEPQTQVQPESEAPPGQVTLAIPTEEAVDDPEPPLPLARTDDSDWTWSASLEGGAVIGGGGAPALTLRAEGGMRFGLVADLTIAMDREQAVGSGSIFWSREFGSVGMRVRWLPAKRWLIDASLSLAAGWVSVHGVTSGASGQADVGACGGVVVGGYELGPFGVFLSARVCGWPWAPQIAVDGVEALKLPVLEGLLGVGLMWGGRGG